MNAPEPVGGVAGNTDPTTWFRALADDTRLRCLMLLAAEGELCVCELTHALAVSQPKASRHLAALRELGAVAVRREGVWMHYRLAAALPNWLGRTLQALDHAHGDDGRFAADRARLAAMPGRPGGRCAPSLATDEGDSP